MNSKSSSVPAYASIATDEEQVTDHGTTGSPVLVTAQAQEVLAVPSSNNEYGSIVDNLTWQDNFYANEPDIVAVIDMDSEAVLAYQRHNGCKSSIFAILFVFFGILFLRMDADFLSLLYFLLAGVFVLVAFQYSKKTNGSSNVHMAFTSTTLRYDQDRQALSKQVPLRQIVSSTTAEVKWRPFWCCGKDRRINVVSLQIAGTAKNLSYVGVKDAKVFQRVLARLQSSRQEA